ncbi:MAG: aromatic ring-hydroxylating oxygenase subunit alpha [Fimbriiglobus sp.]
MTPHDTKVPLNLASNPPKDWYTDVAIAERERDAVFARSWQVIGRNEQVATPGSYITAYIAGEPVVVVRGDDGVLRGFFNVCRHRAAPLLSEPCGQTTKLRCRYHGWTYDLAGQLRGTPEFDGVGGFCKETNGLVPLGAVTEWGPFVAVHLMPPTEPFVDAIAPFADWYAKTPDWSRLRFHARRVYDVKCNWKVYIDNYLDGGYHVNTVHPDLAGVLDYKEYTITTYAKTSLQSSPMKPSDGAAGATRQGDRAAYWWLWPNFMVNHYEGVLDTNYVLPLTSDHCRVIFDFYFAEGTPPSFMDESVRVADTVQEEDAVICEEVQRGLGSRSYIQGRYSVRREAAAHHFHHLLGAALS